MFLPTVTIQRFGLKWTLAFSVLGYLVYTLCNFYPEFYTLIPSAIILGFCAAPLWSSKGRVFFIWFCDFRARRFIPIKAQYLTVSAGKLAELEGVRNDTIVNRFFGIFFCIFQLNQIFGNLISSIVIGQGLPKFENVGNATEEEVALKEASCGMNQPRPNGNDTCGDAALEQDTAYLLMVRYYHVLEIQSNWSVCPLQIFDF